MESGGVAIANLGNIPVRMDVQQLKASARPAQSGAMARRRALTKFYAPLGVFLLGGLADFFALDLPSFIADWGLGGVLNAARNAASVRRCASSSV